MPWKARSVMEERLRFVARLLDGETMTDVCREFGISRKTGYKIFDRYKEHGLEALSDRSRRPVRSTTGTSSSPPAEDSAFIARGSTFPLCSLAKSSASRRSTRAFGSSASRTMIWDISTWSRKPCNLSTTRSARGCHQCLRVRPETSGRIAEFSEHEAD